VLYVSQVLHSVANCYIRCADSRFHDAGPPPFEPIARYLVDGFMADARRPGATDFVFPTLEDGEEPHM